MGEGEYSLGSVHERHLYKSGLELTGNFVWVPGEVALRASLSMKRFFFKVAQSEVPQGDIHKHS